MAKRFAVFITILLSVLSLGHFLVLATAKHFLGLYCGYSDWWLAAAAVLMPLMFVAANFLAFKSYNWFSRIFYKVVVLWIGFFIYLFFAAVLFWIAYDLGGAGIMKPLGEVLYGLAILLGLYGIVNANTTRVTQYAVKLPNLPESWIGKQILFMSDMHFGQVRNIRFAHKIAGMIAELKPELILIGGDMFDGGRAPAHDLAQIFGSMPSPQGIYFVTGNHEEFTESRQNVDALKHHGIKVLEDELVNINGLQIAGVDYLQTASTEGFEKVLKSIEIDQSLPSILIKHVPNRLDIPEKAGFSLQLSGHTHLGQMFPGRLFTKRIFKGYDYGLKFFKRMQVLTSSGAGTWGPPMRVATLSEIVLLTLEKSS